MACGIPVLTSDSSATAEVAADAAQLVDPHSTEAICDGLRTLLADPLLREHYGRQGLQRAATFSWHRAAEETRAVYQSSVLGIPATATVA
jgi:glycosyltransferase involved in cell wall biosynthesis